MQPERLNRARQRRVCVISILLHGRVRQDGAELLQRMMLDFDTMLHRFGHMGFVMNEYGRLTTLHGCVVVGAVSLQGKDKKQDDDEPASHSV